MRRAPTRRRFLQSVGCAGMGTTAGCLVLRRGGSTGEDAPAGESSADASADGGPTATATSTPGSEVREWLADVDSFDGTVTDWTGRDEVTMTVGAEGNGGALAFDPVAVRVTWSTEVTWEWTGDGGAHNVVGLDGDLDSGDPVAVAGVHYENDFDESRTYRYYCEPHRQLGMKGAIVVAQGPSPWNETDVGTTDARDGDSPR